MAAEQRQMVSTHIREQVIPEQPKKQAKIRKSKKWVTTGEKFLYVLLTSILVLFASTILHTGSELNDLNREVSALSSKLDETAKKNIELTVQMKSESTHEKVWEKAKKLGLNLNENNVKVVPGR
ncbi:cell division protein FtsL [Sporosarcina sp. G11-34]|uniref:cell division protein FtsL n=1 Tax=Sporosarcina sp. G11-34 TaxID=2849605 RepID=UPI0022A976DF|nr:cell division protein FtsL [Sporosarcina sp. G11-34]MCZ2257116.1 cell division protein FtsL [Sporosarcina sp. G11-34]